MLTLDGSQGEGGGQILRTSLALAMITATSVRIVSIRARRARPGLQRQHLTAVRAAANVCGARLTGASIGSGELVFKPGPVKPGKYTFDIGSAGSTSLVLQTVLPALLAAAHPSALVLKGGTHNPLAPPFEFLADAFVPLVNRMGPRVSLQLVRHGFYPRGGGELHVEVEPAPLAPLHLRERGAILKQRAVAKVAGLRPDIAERELAAVAEQLSWPEEQLHVEELPRELGPGNMLALTIACEHVTEVFVGFGERGVRAEDVAAGTVARAQEYLAAEVPVDEHLADQLLLPLALAGGGSFLTRPLSLHAQTNIDVIRQFLDVAIETIEQEPSRWLVEVGSTAAVDKRGSMG